MMNGKKDRCPECGRLYDEEVTRRKVASAAAKVLADPKASKFAKAAAASALTQNRYDRGRP